MGALSLAPLPLLRLQRFPRTVTGTLPLLSVIIVNYRRWEETATLVDQLLGGDSLFRDRIEVFVIDNASPPHPLADQLRRNRQVRLHCLRRNRGFAAGVNAGFRLSRGRWLLVLNPDLHVQPGFLDLICSAAIDMEEERPVGVVGFQLRNRDGSHQLSTGFFPTLSKMVLGLLRPRTRRKYLEPAEAERQPVPWVTGSCLMVRRSCLRQLSGFDEEFFLYYEDVDLCLRAQAMGWTVCYEPAVAATHLDPLQNRPLTEPMRVITRHASLTYFRKHLSPRQFWALGQLVRLETWVRQRWAQWRGRTQDVLICQELRGICRDLLHHRPEDARRRLDLLLQRVEL